MPNVMRLLVYQGKPTVNELSLITGPNIADNLGCNNLPRGTLV